MAEEALAQAKQAMADRPITTEPCTSDSFPPHVTCPVCGTNNDGKTVLVPIAGAFHGEPAEEKPMHLACAVIQEWHERMQLGVARKK